MDRHLLITFLAFLCPVLLLPACSQNDTPKPQRQTLQQMSEEVRRNPIAAIPLGLKYLQVKERVDSLSGMRPEGGIESLGREGLFEAHTRVSFDSLQAELEFNFRDSTLYSYYYTAPKLDSVTARRLYDSIRRQYAEDYGEYDTEEQDEGGYRSHSSFWHHAGFDANATLSTEGKDFTVSWGFQSLSGNHLPL